jgi:hypothetical protein
LTNSRMRVRGGRLKPDDNIDFFSFRVNNFFQSFEDAAVYRPSSSEGDMEASKAFKLHANHQTLWAYLSSSTTRSKGGRMWEYEHVRWSRMDPHADFPRRATLAAPKGERRYTEKTPSGAAPTSPPEGVFRHTRRTELDEQSELTTGSSDTLGRLQPTPSEGPQRWHYDTLSSPHLPPSPFIISDDYGPPELLEHGHSRRFRRGRRTFPGTTGQTEQRAD